MKFLKPALKIAISLILIAIVVRAFGVRDITAHFSKVDAATIMLAVAVGLSISLLHAARWIAVIRAGAGHGLDFRSALRIVLIGYFFNQVLPSPIGGDAVRVWCAYRAGMSFRAAAGTVIIDRAMTLFSLFLLTAAGLPWLFEIISDPIARWTLSAVVLAGLAGFGIFLAISGLPRFLSRWRAARALLDLTELARKVMFSPRYALPAILLSVLSFVGFAFIVFCIARAMQLEVTLKDCVLLVPPVILITVVPVSIAGWGVREGAMVVAFGFIQVPASAAFALSVLFGLTLAVASLPGSLLWWFSGYSVKNVVADAVAGTHDGRGAP
jgi:uncharacterized protein (TIRG00374 family)